MKPDKKQEDSPDFEAQLSFQYLQLDKKLQIGYNHTRPRETNSDKEVGKMFFFNCGSNNSGCGSIWQILSQLCCFGC